MPIKKGRAKAKNLGDFALKRKASTNDIEAESAPKQTRVNSPEAESSGSSDEEELLPQNGDEYEDGLLANNSDLDDDDDVGIEVHEEDDISHPKDRAALANWLNISDAHHCGSGVEAHITMAKLGRINRFFFKPLQLASPDLPPLPPHSEIVTSTSESPPPNNTMTPAPETEFLDEAAPAEEVIHLDLDPKLGDVDEDMDATPPPRSSAPLPPQATVEEVDDKEDYLCVDPLQLSPEARAEEGLDELPWDPAEEVSPRPAATLPTPTLPSPPPSSIPPGAAA
ncbi:hypothetical protein C8R46DRAFT_1214096 [Mycena filopes]|nr:hypothetical protein C8R46DRAFT_1214096 [Mycena filopes]